MAFELSANLAFAFATAIALTLFAFVVAWIGKFRGAPLWFLLFEGGFGLSSALGNVVEALRFSAGSQLYEITPQVTFLVALRMLLAFIAVFGLWMLIHRFPTTITDRDRWARAWALLPLLALIGPFIWTVTDIVAETPAGTTSLAKLTIWSSVGSVQLLAGAMWGAVILLAIRYRRATDRDERNQMALMASAICIYPSMYAAWSTMRFAAAGDYPPGALFIAAMLAVAMTALAWLRCTHDGRGAAARNVVFVILLSTLVGMVFSAFFRETSVSGFARILAILVLAYAVLKHQILGIDVQVRFALSKSTIAAVFIAVFFIASEAAQQFFGDTLGSTYVGIGVAGTLVFAMAPLQKAAERLAEKAVPVAAPAGVASAPAASSRREASYRDAVRLAMRDRRVTSEERVSLFRLAEDLSIPAGRAAEIQHELEAGVNRRGR
ncbi:MAG: hypothetical protein QOC71_1176 [Thermoplasmata archaeon]|nr:hypothetical protein [Thermoplasmata archaeon]